jgi:DNA invertase Pin-like site-specific DNA recombinase
MSATAGANRMFPVATDYLRFSGQRQEDGDTKRRQRSLSDAWSQRTGIPIDLRLADEAVSGLKDQERRLTRDDLFDLARYLKLIEAGRVQAGDYLLLENFDRLSRDKEVRATHLLTSILVAGVKVVQLAPFELELTEDSDAFAIFRAVMELSRGHGESARKSQLVAAAYRNNRAAAARGEEVYMGWLPAWVRRDTDGKARHGTLSLIPERAEAVRLIYRLARDGWGYTRITHYLTQNGVPAFGGRQPRTDAETGEHLRSRRGRARWKRDGDRWGAGRWVRTYVADILQERAAMGELRTHTGEVIPIPAAVTEDEWLAAEAARRERDTHGRGRPVKNGPENLFQCLMVDAATGEPVYVITRHKAGREWRVLLNAGAKEGDSPTTVNFPEPVFQEAILRCLREIDPADVTEQGGPDRVAVLTGRLEEVRQQLAELKAELKARTKSPKVALDTMEELEAEQARLEEDRRQAQQEAAHPLSEAWGQAKSLLDVIGTAEQQLRLRSLLRRIVEEIRVLVVPRGWDRVCAVQMCFKGSDEVRSYLIVYRKDVMPDGTRASRRKRQRGEDTWAVRSLRHATPLDLRNPEHVQALAEVLAAVPIVEEGSVQ